MTKSVTFTENRPFGQVHAVISFDGIVFFHGTTAYVLKGVPQYTLDICGSFDDCAVTLQNIMEEWFGVDDMLEYLTLKHDAEKIVLL